MTACSAGDGSTGGRHTGGRMTGSLLRPRGRADASRSVLPTTNQVNLTGPLAAGIPIVEHLCGLDQLPQSGFRFHAAPPQVVGIGTFPVRAYAVLADG